MKTGWGRWKGIIAGDFPYYANPSTVSVTFTTPGTYHYADPYFPSVTGIVVVQ